MNSDRHPLSPSGDLGGISSDNPVRRSALVFSLWDGIFANVMLALTETFGIAAAVFLKAPAIAIAMLGSLPLLLSSIGQLLLPFVTDPGNGRKRYVLRGVLLQSIFLFCTAMSGFLPPPLRIWSYVLLFAFYGFFGNVVSGFWIAWMGDLVPQEIRGRHFAWRNRIFSITQLVCALIAGLIARRYSTLTAHWLVFAGMFIAAGIARTLSVLMMHRQYEPPVPVVQEHGKLLEVFSHTKPFLFYSVAAALVQGTVAIAGPFFNVYYIRNLHFDYFALSCATAATVLGTIIALPFWGKFADTFGNRTVIIITVLLIATVPLPYIASTRPWHIWVLNFYTGCCWSGYNLSNFNYLLLAAGKKNTEHHISFAVAITGICVFCCSMLGGFLATRLPIIFTCRLHSLFLLSSVMRFLIFGLFIVRYPKYETTLHTTLEVFHQIPGYRVGIGMLRNSFRAFRAK
ncbi:MAG: MFS transporter [Chitinispirillaceae bacterium]|nr:MFS transporter [Chitinispirillaceae bacterium]